MLATFRTLGFTPDFVAYHRYEQAPGGENDMALLNAASTWPSDVAAIRQMLSDYLGPKSKDTEINCTETNSVYGNPGKQSTSLVNGLFLADAIGTVMKTELKSFMWWDLRNGQGTGNNNSQYLYGWREYGDYGIVDGTTPAAPADRYPTFYAYKLLTNFARGGEGVKQATSDYDLLGAYAVRDHVAHTVNLLLINKHPVSPLNVSVTVSGFKVGAQANVYSYGIPQDTAAQTGTGSADVAQSTLALGAETFTYAPAPYSATVIKISKHVRHPGDPADDDDNDDDDDDCDQN